MDPPLLTLPPSHIYIDLALGRTELSPDFADIGMRRSVDLAAGKLDCNVGETYGTSLLSWAPASNRWTTVCELPSPDELAAPESSMVPCVDGFGVPWLHFFGISFRRLSEGT